METPQIRTIIDGDVDRSCARLRDGKLDLTTVRTTSWDWRPDGDGYEWLPPRVETLEETHKQRMRVRGARKQRAAKASVPVNIIKVEKVQAIANPEEAIKRIKLLTLRDKAEELRGSGVPNKEVNSLIAKINEQLKK